MTKITIIIALVSCYIAVCMGQASITSPPSNASVLLGENATFTCEVTGTQALGEDLTWRRVINGAATFLGSNSNAANSTKHAVTGKYTFHILDAFLGDEGQYQCVLFPTSYDTYVTVNVAPTSVSLMWPDNRTFTEAGQAANLTCSAGLSRPPATFRWFKGNTEVTNQAVHPVATTDANGYGSSVSTLEQTPSTSEEGTVYKCLVDVPAKAGVLEKSLALSFSGARHVVASLGLILLAAAFSTIN